MIKLYANQFKTAAAQRFSDFEGNAMEEESDRKGRKP